MTPQSIEGVAKAILDSMSLNWKFIARCFSLTEQMIVDIEKVCTSEHNTIAKVSEFWLERRGKCYWWDLGIILIRCSQKNEGQISEIQREIKNMAQYNKNGKL